MHLDLWVSSEMWLEAVLRWKGMVGRPFPLFIKRSFEMLSNFHKTTECYEHQAPGKAAHSPLKGGGTKYKKTKKKRQKLGQRPISRKESQKKELKHPGNPSHLQVCGEGLESQKTYNWEGGRATQNMPNHSSGRK